MQRDDGSLNVGTACTEDTTSVAYTRAGLMMTMNTGQMRQNFDGNTYPGMSIRVAGTTPHQNTATANTKRPALQAAMGGMGR